MSNNHPPAQDERKLVAEALRHCDWSGTPIGNKAIIQRACELLTRPAQPEQPPVGCRYRKADGADRAWTYSDSIVAPTDGYEVQYLAPIAQTEPQPIRLPERKPDFPSSDATGEDWENSGWNAALDEVARLNAAPVAQTAPRGETK